MRPQAWWTPIGLLAVMGPSRNDQIGLPALQRRLLAEAPYIISALPELPRLLHQRLQPPSTVADDTMKELATVQRHRNALLALVAGLLGVTIALLFLRLV